VVVNDLDLARAKQTAGEIPPGQARAVATDVADSQAVRAMFAEIERDFGRVDILVNNAGIGRTGLEREGMLDKAQARAAEARAGEGITTHWDITQNLSDEAWRRMLAVHLDGPFFCTREALRLMSAQGRGVIVNIASVAGLAGIETAPHYGAAKGGILGFTRSVAREVASRGIRVNAICPGFIDTPMTQPAPEFRRAAVRARTPLGRFGEPRDIALTALFLACDDSAFYTGQWLSPNGGLHIA
jgi:3-oxoacyl-[acyl-carrier protein] reductase